MRQLHIEDGVLALAASSRLPCQSSHRWQTNKPKHSRSHTHGSNTNLQPTGMNWWLCWKMVKRKVMLLLKSPRGADPDLVPRLFVISKHSPRPVLLWRRAINVRSCRKVLVVSQRPEISGLPNLLLILTRTECIMQRALVPCIYGSMQR